MPNKFPPRTPDSADSIRENARAKAVRASYEFWNTGNEDLLEQAFAETFAEHAGVPVRARHEWYSQANASTRRKRSRNDRPQNDLGENQRLALEPRGGARMGSVL